MVCIQNGHSNTALLADAGTVDFYLGGTDGIRLGTGQVVRQGNTYLASLKVTLTGSDWEPGTYLITADFGGVQGTDALLPTTGTAELTVTKLDQAAVPAAPTVAQRTGSSITLNQLETAGTGEVQYGYTADGSIPALWQSGTVFSGLQSGKAYTFYARYAGDAYYNPAVSLGTTATTLGVPQTGIIESGESVTLEDGTEITNDGQQVTIRGNGTSVVITPAPNGGVVITNSGTITLPAGSTVVTGGVEITVSGEGATVNPAGEITLPGGGSATVDTGDGHEMVVTMPEGGGTMVPNGNGSLTLPAGSTVVTGGQTITIPETGGTVRPDGSLEYSVTVRFDSRGGSAVEPVRLAGGTKLTMPQQPTRSGYRFTGWYQNAACTVDWDFGQMTVTADLTLYAGWSRISSGGGSGSSGSTAPDDQKPQSNPFTDVSADAYYYDAVQWAVKNGITAGVTDTLFGPGRPCTRAQMVTFLWRCAGSPAPGATVNPFRDVSQSAYYYDAVLWAAEQGITSGTGGGTFSPDAAVIRAQTVTFLYRAAGSPTVSGSAFADVAADAYYADAVTWAAAEGITAGTGAGIFSPNQACTRAQIVTFLYRQQA